MAVTNSQNNQNVPFILSGESLVITGTIAQNAQRAAVLRQYTVMAYNATNKNWVPMTVLNNTAGESMPRGIYLGDDIAAADLVAGAITDCPILVADAIVARSLVVFDGGTLTAASIVNPATVNATSLEYALKETCNIKLEDVEAISAAGL